MNEKKKYIGISFGPITRVLGYARTTRSIWASSYLFSYLAKRTIEPYYKPAPNPDSKDNRCFLTPSMNDNMFNKIDGVGRFSDQYVFEAAEADTLQSLRTHADHVLHNLADNIRLVLLEHKENVPVETIFTYLSRTLRILIFEKEYANGTSKDEIVHNMQLAIALMECRDTFCSTEERNYLAEYLESTSRYSILSVEANEGKDETRHDPRLFSTILECSVGSDINKYNFKLSDNNEKALLNNEQLVRNLESKVDQLLPYQKYIAFVSADGDNFGKTLARLGNKIENKYIEFSDRLNAEVKAYGGQVIYQGGDDIFFFAPVFNRFTQTDGTTCCWDILQLVKSIDDIFDETIGSSPYVQKQEMKTKPSLSYGIAIAYYKFPMFETKAQSEALIARIKDVDGNELKNKINWSVRRHSGQTFGDLIDKFYPKSNCGDNADIAYDNEFTHYLNLITLCLKGDTVFLHSVTHWVKTNQPMLSTILNQTDREQRKMCLANFFDNNFNEKVHDDYKKLLGVFQDFMLYYNHDEGIHKLHVIMRYISLIIKKPTQE